jgi:hypothetical protein
MRTHNGCYVELLAPQSQEDRENLGARSEWYQKRTPLLHVPHTHFFQVASSIPYMLLNAYISFPRMAHRDVYTRRWVTNIDYHVQELFWDNILLPALEETAESEVQANYGADSVRSQTYRSRTASHSGGDPRKLKPETVSAERLWKMQLLMRKKIIEHGDNYERYRSFYVVMESKGMKHLTRRLNALDPWEAVKTAYPALDVEYMRNRANGELVADVGVNIVPRRSDKVVGLWRTEPLVASYESAGFTAGTVHMACQLGRYGGMQASMSAERSRATHIVKAISYNLEYEVTRPASNQATVIEDPDAYHLSAHYLGYVEKRAAQYKRAQNRSFGCRVEYRMGGDALEALCSNPSEMLEKASDFMGKLISA